MCACSYVIYLFASVSQDLWVLVQITDPVMVEVGRNFRRTYGDFSYSNETESRARLTSFTHPPIRNTENFTHLFNSTTGNDYTRHIWDRDVTLVLLVTHLSNSTKFKVTVEQQSYIFLLYFFATFITYVLVPVCSTKFYVCLDFKIAGAFLCC